MPRFLWIKTACAKLIIQHQHPIILHWTWIQFRHSCVGRCRQAQATISRSQCSTSFDQLSVPNAGWTEFQPTCALASWLLWPKWCQLIHSTTVLLGSLIAYYVYHLNLKSFYIPMQMDDHHHQKHIRKHHPKMSQDEPSLFLFRVLLSGHFPGESGGCSISSSSGQGEISGLLPGLLALGCLPPMRQKNMAAHGEHDDW